ncbi:MAG: XdhC family protein [Rhodospirillaceae bacterium]|nr:XdhC family protein [Rhodospirillaceae bacterium]
MKPDTLRALNAVRRDQTPIILATWLDTGEEQLIALGDDYSPDLAGQLDEAFTSDRSAKLEVEGRPLFLHVFNPPLRLLVVGAVHVAEPLARLARTTGYAITIIDPRRAYTDKERFPGLTLIDAWPDDAMAELRPDHRTAVVMLTHDPKIDDPALHFALSSPVFYIGSLGSKRTHAKRIERLKEDGFDDDTIARIKGPVGLDIGAKTAAEIALSVMAEVVAAQRGKLA